MKKFILFSLILVVASMLVTGCNSCSKPENKGQQKTVMAQGDQLLHTLQQDIQATVFLTAEQFGVDASQVVIIPREVTILLRDTFNSADAPETPVILAVCTDIQRNYPHSILSEGLATEIFGSQQAALATSVSSLLVPPGSVLSTADRIDTDVTRFYHYADGTSEQYPPCPGAFYVGDNELSLNEPLTTFNKAYERMMSANYPKPESRVCVLRKPLGPNPCNAQYIFGNTHQQLFVDAITGEVTNENPAFKGFNSPQKE